MIYSGDWTLVLIGLVYYCNCFCTKNIKKASVLLLEVLFPGMHKTPPQNLLPDIIHVKSLFVIGKHFVGMGEFGGHSGLSATETQQYNCQVSNIHTSKIETISLRFVFF